MLKQYVVVLKHIYILYYIIYSLYYIIYIYLVLPHCTKILKATYGFWSNLEKGPADFAILEYGGVFPLPTADAYLPAYMHVFSVGNVGKCIVPHIRLVGLITDWVHLWGTPCDWRVGNWGEWKYESFHHEGKLLSANPNAETCQMTSDGRRKMLLVTFGDFTHY